MARITVIIAVSLLFAFIVSLGIIGLQNSNGSIKGNFYEGQKLHYTISTVSDDLSAADVKDLEIVVNKADMDKKILSYSMTTDRKKTPGHSFTVVKTNNDTSISIDSGIPVIAEIQPEIPNLLPLPDHTGESVPFHWQQEFNRSGTYPANNGVVDYHLVGISGFTGIGNKTVTTRSGTFNCIGIRQDVNYSILESIISPNGTKTEFEKTGYYSGENWFDQRSKLLVYSSFDNHKVTVADVSEANKGILGCEEMYREIPSDVHMTTELVSV